MIIRDISGLLKEAVTAGANKALAESGQLPDTLTRAQAYRLYGRNNVDRWCKEKLIHPVARAGSGKKKFIDRLKLEAVARASNRMTYLQVAER